MLQLLMPATKKKDGAIIILACLIFCGQFCSIFDEICESFLAAIKERDLLKNGL